MEETDIDTAGDNPVAAVDNIDSLDSIVAVEDNFLVGDKNAVLQRCHQDKIDQHCSFWGVEEAAHTHHSPWVETHHPYWAAAAVAGIQICWDYRVRHERGIQRVRVGAHWGSHWEIGALDSPDPPVDHHISL